MAFEKVNTQTSRRVSETPSDRGLHFLTPLMSRILYDLQAQTMNCEISSFIDNAATVLGLHYLIFLVIWANFVRLNSEMNVCIAV